MLCYAPSVTLSAGQTLRAAIRVDKGSILKVRVLDPGNVALQHSHDRRNPPILMGVQDRRGRFLLRAYRRSGRRRIQLPVDRTARHAADSPILSSLPSSSCPTERASSYRPPAQASRCQPNRLSTHQRRPQPQELSVQRYGGDSMTPRRGADTPVCRVGTHADVWRCWNYIAVSSERLLGGPLSVGTPAPRRQVANGSVSLSLGSGPNGAIQPFTATYSDNPWVDNGTNVGGAGDISETDLDINTSAMAVAGCSIKLWKLERRSLFGER